jgi:hypothetical protein
MHDPSGHIVEQRIYRVGNQKFENEDALEVTLLEIPISFPLSLSLGAWRVLAYSDGAQAESAFFIGEYSPATPELRPELRSSPTIQCFLILTLHP